jgi:hypothetical protein
MHHYQDQSVNTIVFLIFLWLRWPRAHCRSKTSRLTAMITAHQFLIHESFIHSPMLSRTHRNQCTKLLKKQRKKWTYICLLIWQRNWCAVCKLTTNGWPQIWTIPPARLNLSNCVVRVTKTGKDSFHHVQTETFSHMIDFKLIQLLPSIIDMPELDRTWELGRVTVRQTLLAAVLARHNG